jgi:hypothetical protein
MFSFELSLFSSFSSWTYQSFTGMIKIFFHLDFFLLSLFFHFYIFGFIFFFFVFFSTSSSFSFFFVTKFFLKFTSLVKALFKFRGTEFIDIHRHRESDTSENLSFACICACSIRLLFPEESDKVYCEITRL